MIDIAILCPREVEFKIIRKILDVSEAAQYQNLSFDVGQINDSKSPWRIAVLEPDLNDSSFGQKTIEVLSILSPKIIFLAGMAGGIKDATIEDIVIGTKAYSYEFGKETNQGFVARPRVIENSSKELLTLARRLSRNMSSTALSILGDTKFHFGPIASGHKVIASLGAETYKKIKIHYNDTLAVEMEAYEFARAASQAKKQYLNIRGISDLINEKGKSDQAGNQEKASRKVALFLKQLIRELPALSSEKTDSVKVSFSLNKFPFYSLRKTEKAILTFKDDFIELKVANQAKPSQLKNLKHIEHLRMSGDLAKSWVKIIYEKNNQEKEIFFSETSPLGFGYWFGGSKNILNRFKDFKNRQTVFS